MRKTWNYYNDTDPAACEWARELIRRKLVPQGEVDCRSIVDVQPEDLKGFTQCHFFSGILGWSLALKLAGWPEDRPVFTGSCPCQPFSVAGKGGGTADERHLWPVFLKLIEECRPEFVFGEQVASAAVVGSASGKAQLDPEVPVWLDGVFADLEAASYACAAADIPAAGVGAPHIRQRLFWGATSRLADTGHESTRRSAGSAGSAEAESGRTFGESPGCGDAGRMAFTGGVGSEAGVSGSEPRKEGVSGILNNGSHQESERMGDATGRGLGEFRDAPQSGSRGHSNSAVELGGLADTDGGDSGTERQQRGGEQRLQPQDNRLGEWGDYQLINCRDDKYRRVPHESLAGFQPLVDARIYLVPGMARRGSVRPALLKGSGNAIVPEAAAKFVKAFIGALNA